MSNEENKPSKNERFKHTLAYVPAVAIVLLFAEDNKSKALMKHIKYGISLLVIYVLLRFVLVTVLHLDISAIIAAIYGLLSLYLWYKAYTWEDINLEYIDKMEEKVKDNFKENFPEDIEWKVKKKLSKATWKSEETEKKEETSEEKKEEESK